MDFCQIFDAKKVTIYTEIGGNNSYINQSFLLIVISLSFNIIQIEYLERNSLNLISLAVFDFEL